MIRTKIPKSLYLFLFLAPLFSLPFSSLLPKNSSSQSEQDYFNTPAPPPMEGKFYKVETISGTMTMRLNNPLLGDTTIVTNLEDQWEQTGEIIHFSNGNIITYNSDGSIQDSGTYTWNESIQELTMIDPDTSITFQYSSYPNGMNLSMPDTTWTISVDTTGFFPPMMVTMENVNYLFLETNAPVSVNAKNLKSDRGVLYLKNMSGLKLTWKPTNEYRTLKVMDLRGKTIREYMVNPFQSEIFIDKSVINDRMYLFEIIH